MNKEHTAGFMLCADAAAAALMPAAIGGKARGLLLLAAAGARVPPWRVIPADVAAARPWRGNDVAADALRACFDALRQPPFQGVAVRSSAQAEDGVRQSCAGQFATLFVTDAAALIDAVEQVLFSGGDAGHSGGMAVILQSWVAAQAAGVLFSADPAAAHPDQCCIEAVHGQGAALVGGRARPSRFYLDFTSGEMLREAPGADGPESLNPAWIADLLAPLHRIEERMHALSDVEWAADADGVWFLQARPITAICPHPGLMPDRCATSWFFDQRFTEPIRPITRSALIPRIARIALGEALAMRGAPPPKDLETYYGGQVYAPHAAYRAMLRGAPRWFLSQDLRQLFPARCACAQEAWNPLMVLHYAACAVIAVLRERRDVFRNIRAWDQFRETLRRTLAEMPDAMPETESAWRAAWARLDALNDRFLRLHRWSYLWANYAYRIWRMPAAFLTKPHAARREQRLWQSLRLPTAQANAALRAALACNPSAEALETLRRDFGHRSPSLDYATPTWAELADAGQLQVWYGETPPPAPASAHALPAHPRGPKRILARLLAMREEQRFEWERVLARQRRMLRQAGEYLAARGIIPAADDAWFLEWDALIAARYHGAPVSRDTLARHRHAFYFESLVEKPLFIGPVPHSTKKPGAQLRGIAASPGVARGRAVVLRTPAELPSATDAPIIAVLRAMDPAWTILLARAQGVVLERGGVLSHAAILAREQGVPLVIGVEGATQTIAPGAAITVDGYRGLVHIHDTDQTNSAS